MNVIIHVVFGWSPAEFEVMKKREVNTEKGSFTGKGSRSYLAKCSFRIHPATVSDYQEGYRVKRDSLSISCEHTKLHLMSVAETILRAIMSSRRT